MLYTSISSTHLLPHLPRPSPPTSNEVPHIRVLSPGSDFPFCFFSTHSEPGTLSVCTNPPDNPGNWC